LPKTQGGIVLNSKNKIRIGILVGVIFLAGIFSVSKLYMDRKNVENKIEERNAQREKAETSSENASIQDNNASSEDNLSSEEKDIDKEGNPAREEKSSQNGEQLGEKEENSAVKGKSLVESSETSTKGSNILRKGNQSSEDDSKTSVEKGEGSTTEKKSKDTESNGDDDLTKREKKVGLYGSELKYGADFFRDQNNYIFNEKDVHYQGKDYVRNSAIKAYIILGVDRRGGFKEGAKNLNAGQSDAIFVLAHDTANRRVRLIQVHRDSMAPVTITANKGGEELDRQLSQITVAFGYGDGSVLSVEYLAKSLSDLFGGFKFNGYFAGTLENIEMANDFIGGVEVTVEEEGLEKHDPSFVKGSKVLLIGEKAEKYLRGRDITKNYTAYKRLDRHRQYLDAFNQKMKKVMKNDPDVFVKLFNLMQDTTLTSMRKDEYVKIGMDMVNSGNQVDHMVRIPGFIETKNRYEEFYPDMEELRKIILENFYRVKQ